jgi:hypothetical protein
VSTIKEIILRKRIYLKGPFKTQDSKNKGAGKI